MATRSQLINALGDLLKTGDEADRCYASRALGTLQDDQATPWLIDHLRDDDIDVCVDAAEALGLIGDSAAVAPLLESLANDPEGEVKTAVVGALAQLGGDDVIPRLIEIVEKRPENLLFDDADDWDPWWDMQLNGVISLGEFRATEAIPVLKRILDDQELQDIESEVLTALARIGGEANAFLLERLQQGTARQRRRVARSLGKNRDQDTLAPLGRALSDNNADVRDAAITSLAQRNAARYLPAILLLFRDNAAQVRDAAVKAARDLSKNSSDSGLQAGDLVQLLEDPDSRVRKTVLETLKHLPQSLDEVTRTRCLTALQDTDADVVAAACHLLTSKRVPHVEQRILATLIDPDKPTEIRCRILESLGGLDEWNDDIENALIREIISGEKTVRLAALDTLATLDHSFPAQSTPPDTIAGDNEPATLWPIEIITAAVSGQLIKPQPIDKVIPIVPADPLETADENVAAATQADTVEEESRPAPQSTLDAILQNNEEAGQLDTGKSDPDKMKDEDDEETAAFKKLLAENKARTRRMFSRESDNVEVAIDVRRQAARMLGRTHSATAIQALAAALDEDDPVLQLEAAESLGQISHSQTNPPALEKILDSLRSQLQSPEQSLRVAAVRSLGTIGHPDDLQTLLDLVVDDELFVRIESVRALTGMLAENGTDTNLNTVCHRFVTLLTDKESGVRRAAIQGLSKLLGNPNYKDDDSIREKAVEAAIEAGFMGADGQASVMADALKILDPELGTKILLVRLAELPNSVERRFAIEMLTEIHRPDGLRPAAAA